MTKTRLWIILSGVILFSGCTPQPTKEVPEPYKRGQKVFHRVCSNCHNSDAMGGLTKAPKLIDSDFIAQNFSDAEIRDTILNGSQSGKMPPQKAKIKSEEITEIIKYLRYSQQAAGIIEEEEDDIEVEYEDEEGPDKNKDGNS